MDWVTLYAIAVNEENAPAGALSLAYQRGSDTLLNRHPVMLEEEVYVTSAALLGALSYVLLVELLGPVSSAGTTARDGVSVRPARRGDYLRPAFAQVRALARGVSPRVIVGRVGSGSFRPRRVAAVPRPRAG